MLSIDAIATDLTTLSISRCLGENARWHACPNRVSKEKRSPSRICRRCDDARARILAFVSERASAIARRLCRRSIREDVVADVVLEYAERLQDGSLLRAWDTEKSAWSIASEDFLIKRMLTAANKYAGRKPGQTFFVVNIEVEACDVVQTQCPKTRPLDSEKPLDFKQVLHPHRWTGTATEVVAALQLFPYLRRSITANASLLMELADVLSTSDPVALLDSLHREKARELTAQIDARADAALKSRYREKDFQYRDEIEDLRLRSWLTPLGAPDLMCLLGLGQDAANKRMLRYREYLADAFGLSNDSRASQVAAHPPRAGPRSGGPIVGKEIGNNNLRVHGAWQMNPTSRFAAHSGARARHVNKIRFMMTCRSPADGLLLRMRFTCKDDLLKVSFDNSIGSSVRAVRLGGFPALKETVGAEAGWHFIQPTTPPSIREFLVSDLVISLEGGGRFRIRAPFASSLQGHFP